jgi:hypothetical protein
MHPFNWKPVQQSIIKNQEIADEVNRSGYAVVDFLSVDELNKLEELYHQHHNIQVKDGGMFYSVYSKDVIYRKKIHAAVNEILQNAFDRFLTDYRVALNAFVIKAPGPKSEFNVHQDGTGIDEFKYSTLSIWIPLADIHEKNGALCVIPKSHRMFSPYRGISFPAPYEKIQSTVKKYLYPVYLKRGQAIFFDNRLVHNSMNNQTAQNRAVIVSSILPKDAEIITCFKSPDGGNANKIELIKHEDAFLLEYDSFLDNCHLKPNSGTTVGFVEDKYPELNSEEFENLCKEYQVEQYTGAPLFVEDETCHMIAEPVS